MITAHLPSGYVLGRTLPSAALVLPAAVLGGIFPDFDMNWFYLVDERAFHHHRYWVHAPGFWVMVAAVALPAVALFTRPYLRAALAFFGAIGLHLCLDTLAGDIMWRWPFSTEFTHFVTIPAVYDAWVLNFILHWVFALELAIWSVAIWLWLRR